MKILVNTSSYPRYEGDGAAPFVKSLSEALHKLGHDVVVVAPYDIDTKPDTQSPVIVHRFRYIFPKMLHIIGHARSLRADAKLCFIVPLILPLFLIASIINLVNHGKKLCAQVIYNHWVLPNGVSAAIASKILKIPFMISLHGSDIFMADKNFIFRAITRWVFAQSAYVTACSQELYDRAKKINPNINIILLAWGADPNVFKPIKNRGEIREKYGWDKEEVVLTGLGRFVNKKGFDRLLKIMPELLSKYPYLRLAIGGSGHLEAEFKTFIFQKNLQNKVTLLGQIPWNEVPEFIAASDIFVLPSQRDQAGNVDGLPTVLLEAMACGLPCVASNIGGMNLVITDRSNGLLVEPEDDDELADSISTLVSDIRLRKTLANNARVSVINEFNWIRVAQKIEDLLQKSLRKPRKRRLGQLYRVSYLQKLNLQIGGEKVLDIGCYDQEWLSSVDARLRVGLDIEPGNSEKSISMIKANGCLIPFPENCFNVIYLLDVIEHVENDQQLIRESFRVLKPNGTMILTTPHINIKLFPRFLSKLISKKWGHTIRPGYQPEHLLKFFDNQANVKIYLLKSKWYRFLYLPLRMVFLIFPKLTKRILNLIVEQESRKPFGDNGFILLEITKH